MATMRAMGGGIVPVEYKTIATASANQTYAQQLTQLETTFNTLTTDEKERSIVIDDSNGYHFAFIKEDTGEYSLVRTITNNSYFLTMHVKNHNYFYTRITTSDSSMTFNDRTSSTNTSTLRLMLLTNI